MLEAQIKTAGPITVAYAVMHGPYSLMPEGYARLYQWVEHYGLQPAGMPEAVYITQPAVTPEDQAEYELWAPIAGGAGKTAPEDDGIGVKRVEAETVASAMHKGSYDDLAATYDELSGWIGEHGYQVVGPPREVYYSDPNETGPEDTLTEIQFPVARA